jgi:hypothetical protein
MHAPVACDEDGRLEEAGGLVGSTRTSSNFAISMKFENAAESSESEEVEARAFRRRECALVDHWRPDLGFSNQDNDHYKRDFLKRTTNLFHELEVLM